MGKKARKTRWRTLAINSGDHSDSEESNANSGHHQISKGYQQRPYYSKFPYSSQSTPIRSRFQNEAKSTRSSSTTSENKITFNEDEYTRITTPRQDVLFKKGYLSKPKTYQTQTSTGNSTVSTGNSTGNGTPDHQSADGTEGTDLECEPQFVFPNGFVDQNGIYYVNSYEPYPPFVVYNAPYCYSEYPPTRSKRYSTDSLTESTSPHNEETSQDQSQSGGETVNLPEANQVFGVIYPTACYYTNGIAASAEPENADTEPRKVKKRRRRKLSKPVPDGTSSDEYESDEVVSEIENRIIQGTHRPNIADSPVDKPVKDDLAEPSSLESNEAVKAPVVIENHRLVNGDGAHMENGEYSGDSGNGESPVEALEVATNVAEVKKDEKVTLKPDAKEFVPRSYRAEHTVEFINMPPNFIPIPLELSSNFTPTFLPPGIPINFIPPDKLVHNFVNFVPNFAPKPYEALSATAEVEEVVASKEEKEVASEATVTPTDAKTYPKSNIDIAKIVSKLEEAAKEQRFYENRKQKYSPHKFNKNFNKPRFERSYSEHKVQKRNSGFNRKHDTRRRSLDEDDGARKAVEVVSTEVVGVEERLTKEEVVAECVEVPMKVAADVAKFAEMAQKCTEVVQSRLTGSEDIKQVRRISPEGLKKPEVQNQSKSNEAKKDAERKPNPSLTISSKIPEPLLSTPEAQRPKPSPIREPDGARAKPKSAPQRRPVNTVHKPPETCSTSRTNYAETLQRSVRASKPEKTSKPAAKPVSKPEVAKPGPNQWISVSRKKRNKNRAAEDDFDLEDSAHAPEDEFEVYDVSLLKDVVITPEPDNKPVPEPEMKNTIVVSEVQVEAVVIAEVAVVESREHDELDLLIESLKEMEVKAAGLKKKKATPKAKRVMITDVDLTEVPLKKEVAKTPVKLPKKLEVVKKKEEVVEVKVEEESPEKKRVKKKKKPVKTKSLSNSSSSTTLNNFDDTYDFLLNETLMEDERTNVEVSEELDKIIQRGMYSSLEEKIKSLNITAANDGFFKTISFSSKVEKPSILKPNDMSAVLSSGMFKSKSVEESASLVLDAKAGAEAEATGSFLDVTSALEEPGVKEERLYPITQAVKEWMTKTRETTPEVELLKSPSTILKELNSEEEEVTVFSAGDWSLTPQTSLEEDLLECWDDGADGAVHATQQPQHPQEHPSDARVDVGEDVLEAYDSRYGTNDDYLKIKAELEEKKRNGTFPKHANLPYRAICCSLM